VPRNRAAALATGEGDVPEGDGHVRLAQRAPECLDGVRASERNIAARVSAEAPLTVTRRVAASESVASRGSSTRIPCVGAAGAADGQPPVLLTVEVNQDRAVDERRVEAVRPLETDLRGYGHRLLQGAVRQRVVLDERHQLRVNPGA